MGVAGWLPESVDKRSLTESVPGSGANDADRELADDLDTGDGGSGANDADRELADDLASGDGSRGAGGGNSSVSMGCGGKGARFVAVVILVGIRDQSTSAGTQCSFSRLMTLSLPVGVWRTQ